MKLILLSQGKFAKVDDEDYERINGMGRWHYALAYKDDLGYACRNPRIPGNYNKRIYYLMHRVIMGAEKGTEVDHINGDGTDNRKINLRVCTPSENRINRRKMHPKNTSGFTGVTWDKSRGLWKAGVQRNGKSRHLGNFETAELAGEAVRKFMEGRNELTNATS